MNLFLQLLLVAISIFFVLKTRRRTNRESNTIARPPGPHGLPLIGNLHQLSTLPHLYFHELSKTYGPLVSLRLGFVPTLVVSSAKMAREVMKTHDHIFSDRPASAANQKLSYDGLGVVFSPYGEYWREIRKVCVLHLFSSNMVKYFSPIREEEVYYITQKISHLCVECKPVDLSQITVCLTSNIICRIAFGKRYDGYNARCGLNFQYILRRLQAAVMNFHFSDYFPSMEWVDKLTGTSAHLHKVFNDIDPFYEEIIEDHLKNRQESRQEDIVEVLLKLQGDKSFGIDITREHIKAILMDIFVAGSETSAATLVWTMTELMKNPESMKRLQEEVRTSMGNNIVDEDMIKEEDLDKLEYLKAVVKETFRLHPTAPLLIPRQTTEKCGIEGYEIEEKTLVFVNAWAIGRDPESWDNPEAFKPERFLGNKPIDYKGQDFELIPFGSGRRICPGLQIAAATLELALANLIYFFNWTIPLGMEKDVLDTSVLPGITTHKKNPLCLLAKKP